MSEAEHGYSCTILIPDQQEGARGNYHGPPATLWPDGVVYYAFDTNVNATNQQRTLDAMAEIETIGSCAGPPLVSFVPRTTEPNYILFTDSNENSSFIGMIGGEQLIRMNQWHIHYLIIHEIYHALGVVHEQQRSDRDTYVEIVWENIEPGKEGNFLTNPNYVEHGPYDFDSIMHYSKCAFNVASTCGTGDETVLVLPPYTTDWQYEIGDLDNLSDGDWDVIVHLYGPDCNGNLIADHCDITSGFSLDCNSNGIPDECETPDCNGNNIPDECDLASGFSVDLNGNGQPDECDTVYVPTDYPTIQSAINAVIDQMEIVVEPGTYTERIDLLGKTITVRSAGGPTVTTIDGEGAGRVVTRASGTGEGATVEGFTITGGTHPASAILGGGVFIDNGAHLTLRNCRITNNTAAVLGAGIGLESGSLSIENCVIDFNHALGGGGLFMASTDVEIVDSLFMNNTAQLGGALAISGSVGPTSLTITNTIFDGNSSTDAGGGIYGNGSVGEVVELVDCTFNGNTAGSTGGAIYHGGGTDLQIDSSVFCESAPNDIHGTWTDNGGNCFAASCQDVNGDGIPDVCQCLADVSGDDTVNIVDLLAVLAAWGPCDDPCPPTCAEDTNGDCAVSVIDLLAVLGAWGACP